MCISVNGYLASQTLKLQPASSPRHKHIHTLYPVCTLWYLRGETVKVASRKALSPQCGLYYEFWRVWGWSHLKWCQKLGWLLRQYDRFCLQRFSDTANYRYFDSSSPPASFSWRHPWPEIGLSSHFARVEAVRMVWEVYSPRTTKNTVWQWTQNT